MKATGAVLLTVGFLAGAYRTVAEVESRYQFLQVVRSGEPGSELTRLKINEGLDSFHSVALAGTPFSGGRYYDYHAFVPWLVSGAAAPH